MIKPKKSLGQNFLINPKILDKIISTAEISKGDLVLEIGPGTGNLTRKLAENAGQVVAIEKDNRLIDPLKETLKSYSNVSVVEGDVLESNITELIEDFNFKNKNSGYKVAGNIPYYITSHLLRKIFEDWPKPKLAVLMIQKEVAQRILAKPPHMNLLALSVQYYSEPKIAGYISRNNFRPVPKVDSAVIRLEFKQTVRNREQNEEIFKLMRFGFSEKRKKLATLLSKKLEIDKNGLLIILGRLGINENIRAENLSLDQWQKLKDSLSGL